MGTSLTILFADISGSTQLYDTLGDVDAKAIVTDCLSLLTEIVRQHQGRVIKTIGDEIMAAFPEPNVAVKASCQMQVQLSRHLSDSQQPLGLRVGLNFGSVLEEGSDIFGDAVNVAARMVGLAKVGEVLTTAPTVSALNYELQAQTRPIDRLSVKGKHERITVCEVIWKKEGLTLIRLRQRQTGLVQPHLQLRFHGKTLEVGADQMILTLGRAPENDLVVTNNLTSRNHARIEFRRGKFVFVDQSTNGSYLLIPEGSPVFLHREESLLPAQGWISLGEVGTFDDPEAIHFLFVPPQLPLGSDVALNPYAGGTQSDEAPMSGSEVGGPQG